MTEIEKTIKRIMDAPVSGLVRLDDRSFEVVLSMILAERLKDWPSEVKPVEIKRKVKHGKTT